CNEEGLYIFELVVSDGFAESEPDVVEVITVDVGVNQRDLVFEIPNYNHYGDVSGTKVVYAEGGACDFGWDNECQDLATGAVYRWDEPEMLTTRHKIEGDIVVWSGGPSFGEPWYHEPLNIGVFARSLTTEVQTTLRQYTMSESYSHPIISGNTVVWLEHLNLDTLPLGSSEANNWWNTAYNVCGADITDLEHPCYFTIDVNVGTRDPYVCYTYAEDFDDVIDICGDIVVWEADGDIYGADISDLNDIRVFSICNDAARQYDPAISGNIVVWVDERNDGGDIYGADISDLEDISLFEIVKESGSQKEPAISGCIIVYVDVSDGLYGGDIRTCCLTRCHGVLDIELTGSPYGMGPAIDGSLIVWQDDYYGKGRGISLEVAYSIADGPVENVTKGKRYDYVQHAVNAAAGDDEIVVGGGIYRENVRWKGKNLTVRSVDPGDPAVVAATVIQAGCAGPVLSIVAIDGAGWASVLSGFTITGGRTGIYCSGACPIITNCRVVSNTGAGIEWWTSLICRYPVLANCLVAGNEGTGVDFQGRGNPSIINCIVAGNLAGGIHARNPSVTNCTVVGNALWGVTGAGGRIANCIIRDNAAGAIASSPVVTYSDIEGGWAGVGNMDADPCFVQPGYWDSNSLWVDGDYHLAAGSPCVDAGANAAVPPDTTDLDGDGNTIEPVPCDLDGNVRMVDGDNDGNCVVDIGAHEFFLPPIEVAMKFTPSSLNPASQGNWIKLHFVLPQGYGVEDVDVSKPAECRLMDTGEMVESEYLNVFVNEEGLVEVEAAFDRSAFSLCLSQPAERTVTIMGLLAGAGGQDFYGTHTIKIINNTLQQIAALASYWLDWCTGFDLDDNGVVNFADFALIDGCRGQLVNE
ncbi:MAG: right-handed parallel beta-helix repeat-containing protein, partial [Planctomycetota bacterium]